MVEAGIPFRSIELVTAERKGLSDSADHLPGHPPMASEEIAACKGATLLCEQTASCDDRFAAHDLSFVFSAPAGFSFAA